MILLQIGQTASAQSVMPLHDNVCWSYYERLMTKATKNYNLMERYSK